MAHLTLLLFAGLLAWAAFEDARTYLIRNRVCAAVAALYPAYALSCTAPSAMLPSLVAAVAVLALGIALFSRGLLGGGDVKLMAAVSLWAGPALVLPFVFVTGIAGGALSLALVTPRLFSRSAAVVAAPPVPYGVAVAAGGLYVASRLLAGM
jgi:prepilin peptidase CpaA